MLCSDFYVPAVNQRVSRRSSYCRDRQRNIETYARTWCLDVFVVMSVESCSERRKKTLEQESRGSGPVTAAIFQTSVGELHVTRRNCASGRSGAYLSRLTFVTPSPILFLLFVRFVLFRFRYLLCRITRSETCRLPVVTSGFVSSTTVTRSLVVY